MASSISIVLDPPTVQIQTGGRASARVTLVNRGDTVGQYALDASGVDPSWLKVEPAQLGVFPGDSAAAQLSLRPPAAAASATYRVVVHVQNLQNPTDQSSALLSLTVQRPGDAASTPRPPGEDVNATVIRASGAVPLAQPQPAQTAPAGPAAPTLRAASPSGQLVLTADREGFHLPAGSRQSAALGLSNTGGAALNVELLVKGPPLSWVELSAPTLMLGPGESTQVKLTIAIPEGAPLGTYPLAVVAQPVVEQSAAPAAGASQSARLNLQLEVVRAGELTLTLNPQQAQGEMSAAYALQVSQTGQSALAVNLAGQDKGGALEFSFSPASLQVPPGGGAAARMMVRARSPWTASELQTIPFTVTALPLGGGASAGSADGRFTQLRAAPVRLLASPDEVRDPSQADFTLRMVNPGASPTAYNLSAVDPDGTCQFRFDPPLLNLPAQGEASAALRVIPNELVSAGEAVHTLRVSAQAAGPLRLEPITVEVRFVQTAGQPPSLALSPASQTGSGPAAYWIQIANPRPTALRVELRASDREHLCAFTIDPPALEIPPMYQARARLDVRPLSGLVAGEERRLCAFRVDGYSESLPAPLAAEGSLLQVAGLTWRKLLPIFIAALVLLGVGGVGALALLYLRLVH